MAIAKASSKINIKMVIGRPAFLLINRKPLTEPKNSKAIAANPMMVSKESVIKSDKSLWRALLISLNPFLPWRGVCYNKVIRTVGRTIATGFYNSTT